MDWIHGGVERGTKSSFPDLEISSFLAPMHTRVHFFSVYVLERHIIYQLFRLCSPMDLVNIRRVCRFFYMALEATPEAWTLARQHMDDIPAPPAVFASGFWGETAYANFIFGSSLCIVCSRLCQGLPSCFALNFRCCSTRCKDRVENGHIVSLIHWTLAAAAYSESYEALGFYEWLPPTHRVGTFLPRDTVLAKAEEIKQAKETSLSGLALPPAFVLRSYEELLEEWSRRLNSWPSILQNGIELAEWAEQYKVTTSLVFQENQESLRRYWAHTDSVYPITDVMDTPTATNIISVFTRDQTVVDSATWHRSLSNINNELWALERERHSFMPELVIVCSACTGRLDLASFQTHCEVAHPLDQLHCLICDPHRRSKPKFKAKGLYDHTVAKHNSGRRRR